MSLHKEKFKLGTLIESTTGFRVLPLTAEIRADLEPFVRQAILDYNAGPVFPGRPNEFGNHMETVLRLTSDRFCKPAKANGKKQATGYPDLRFDSNHTVVYPEIKTLAEGSDASDMRSFYLSTFDKITADAVHVVIGFEHKEKVLTGRYHIVDMVDKILTVKVEYACSNRELYEQRNAN
jgi:hypothetical protein